MSEKAINAIANLVTTFLVVVIINLISWFILNEQVSFVENILLWFIVLHSGKKD